MNREEYLQILFDDLGFTRDQRNAWLSKETGRKIRYLDDLSGAEQSGCLDKLKAMKPEPPPVKKDEDEDE